MKTVSIQRHIIAEVQIKRDGYLYAQDMTIEVRGSTIYFRSGGCMTECDTLQAKQNVNYAVNAAVALIPDMYDYERTNIGRFVLELI